MWVLLYLKHKGSRIDQVDIVLLYALNKPENRFGFECDPQLGLIIERTLD